MHLLTFLDEDFTNYKKPSMFLGTIKCGGKCCIEQNLPLSVCQNDEWRNKPPLHVMDDFICKRYMKNYITDALVIGGLEPFEQFDEVYELIKLFRTHTNDDVVIYTGYNPEEIIDQVEKLMDFKNIIIKFGRYIPDRPSKFDEVLGVTLASDNQYAERIS